jgi:hypothetical protein
LLPVIPELVNKENIEVFELFYRKGNIMPRGDGTGPVGMGPMTGRAAGFCAGFNAPGFMSQCMGRGFRGFWRHGAGRGWRNRFCTPWYPANTPQVYAQQEVEYLKEQAQYLKESLDEINKRIEQLQTKANK